MISRYNKWIVEESCLYKSAEEIEVINAITAIQFEWIKMIWGTREIRIIPINCAHHRNKHEKPDFPSEIRFERLDHILDIILDDWFHILFSMLMSNSTTWAARPNNRFSDNPAYVRNKVYLHTYYENVWRTVHTRLVYRFGPSPKINFLYQLFICFTCTNYSIHSNKETRHPT